MIELKSRNEIEKMRRANAIIVEVMARLKEKIAPGVTTGELDTLATEWILKSGGKPAFKGYRGFPATLCTSVNEEVVHGIPGKRALKAGDIVSIDCGVEWEGFFGDHAWTFPVGTIGEAAQKLLAVTEGALYHGIAAAKVGNRVGDISEAVETFAAGYGVVREYVGHGVGRKLHEEPQVPNVGKAGTGIRLKAGMVLAIEPMINIGTYKTKVLADQWTVVTDDGSLSAQFEHSVAITETGPEILSKI